MNVKIKGSVYLNDVGGHVIYHLNMSTQPDASDIGINDPTRFGLMTFIMFVLHRRRKRQSHSRFREDGEQQFCDMWTFISLRGGGVTGSVSAITQVRTILVTKNAPVHSINK